MEDISSSDNDDDRLEETRLREQAFHGAVREYLVTFLLFLFLYGLSYVLIRKYKKRSERDELYAGDDEDYLVYRISVWICTFSLAVSMAAVLLLPFSVLSNEILRLYPESYYMKWLNTSLVHSLWTYVFLLSNMSIFILLPFSYFFIESQGFQGLSRGIRTRVYEALAVCGLSLLVVFCISHIISVWLDEEKTRIKSLFAIWNIHLPLIYSYLSLFGVITLLICTPYGFTLMFTVVGDLIVRPKDRQRMDEEWRSAWLEELSLQRKDIRSNGNGAAGTAGSGVSGNGNGSVSSGGGAMDRMQRVRAEIERQHALSKSWLNSVKYPTAMLLLLALTGIVVLMVVSNIFQLLVGFKSLPPYRQLVAMELGNSSVSKLGLFGAILEAVIILYMMVSSLVGLYSAPLLRRIRPKSSETSMTVVILNCGAILILSSALPVLANTLGMTNFDLLGAYGTLDWLGHFNLVCGYNVLFAGTTLVCLLTSFTANVRRELIKRLGGGRVMNRTSSTSISEPTSPFTLNNNSNSSSNNNNNNSHAKQQ